MLGLLPFSNINHTDISYHQELLFLCDEKNIESKNSSDEEDSSSSVPCLFGMLRFVHDWDA